MERTVSLVATTEAIERHFPGSRKPSSNCRPGIMSARFPVDPEKCTSKFGKWLAERITTTRFDDDRATLRVTLRLTEEDLHIREMAQRMTSSSVRSEADAESLHQMLERWIERRRSSIKCYGEHAFAPRTIHYEWPVYGSAKAEHLDTVEAYFDLCTKRIRALKPARVRLWNGEEPPEALQVTVDHPVAPSAIPALDA